MPWPPTSSDEQPLDPLRRARLGFKLVAARLDRSVLELVELKSLLAPLLPPDDPEEVDAICHPGRAGLARSYAVTLEALLGGCLASALVELDAALRATLSEPAPALEDAEAVLARRLEALGPKPTEPVMGLEQRAVAAVRQLLAEIELAEERDIAMKIDLKPFEITLPPELARAQELVNQALGPAPAIDLKALVASYRAVKPELRLEALSHDPWGGDPALGLAFVEEGRRQLKTSRDEARSFAQLGRQVAAVLLAPSPTPTQPPIREIAFDLAANAVTLYAESRVLDGNAKASWPLLKEAETYLKKGTGDPYPAAAFLQVKALAVWVGGHPRRAISLLRDAAQISASVEDFGSQGVALLRECLIYTSMDNEPKARAAFQKAFDLYGRMCPDDRENFENFLLSLMRD